MLRFNLIHFFAHASINLNKIGCSISKNILSSVLKNYTDDWKDHFEILSKSNQFGTVDNKNEGDEKTRKFSRLPDDVDVSQLLTAGR